MAERPTRPDGLPPIITLVVRRIIRATPQRLFDAWTVPEQLRQWWGPQSVVCIDAAVDLRVGGEYRIANQFPDGKVLWISGEFEAIERPRRLVYTWRVSSAAGQFERVSVNFEAQGQSTEVIVTHEHVSSAQLRDLHEQGWGGCLDGLVRYVDRV